MKITIDTEKKELTLHEAISYDELCKIITNGTSEGWTILPAKEEPTINKWVAPIYTPCPNTTPNLPNWPNKVTC